MLLKDDISEIYEHFKWKSLLDRFHSLREKNEKWIKTKYYCIGAFMFYVILSIWILTPLRKWGSIPVGKVEDLNLKLAIIYIIIAYLITHLQSMYAHYSIANRIIKVKGLGLK
ncbi:hypothetical protein V7247_30090, partial [Priestia megaterium]|uniref:hypothetical protein n=1 Tax=Priestia megaterium TaxID=1404 RepID=UPI002FFE9F21